ncbi:cell wall-active antibiotics response protein LiaF [Salipaludibacillus daqingensis]|uniref:cell wall-active antibiotics response protein LiaF n=1 Tax=Salipaludibacillus daqingensis TaxID=3041001 RepID=UPI002476C34E|nr:cell wall-active antibiotics response protein LiaF [Salipaludibacillus daqingensis]
MFKRIPTRTFNLILMITMVILLFELMFSGGGIIFTALFLGFLMYLGWKNYESVVGKVLFWVGAVSLALNVLSMVAVRFLFIALIVLFFLQYRRSRKEPDYIKPRFTESGLNTNEQVETLTEIKPLFQHRFFGDLETEDVPYQWRDVNIHGAFGDRVIDLSNTVIPEEAVISIRHFIGNIIIYVPYEVEVSVHHSSVFGRLSIFQQHEMKLMNQSVVYRTENFQQGKPRVKIVTSIFSGDIEVKRI